MEIIEGPWVAAEHALALEQVPADVLAALAGGDLEAARGMTTLPLTGYLVAGECRGVWRRRLAQIAMNPGDAAWVTRLAVDLGSGSIVGRAGFHGPPNEDGMVEVGYAIDPDRRRRGHARAALEILLEVARAHPGVAVVRATVRPDNLASRRLLDQYGFLEVGVQWDDEDGLETILEVAAGAGA
ncbi:hypothetical protein GCM10009715_38020 [Paeniglutamicibacter psychrophenolicus]|uniref:RimJ/RimL family protein N-acetyltransferase n=1 Tax=Paeniglutamicibacter psychrophenolicus TaxID=257454 RepID=A0ABS4W875_9MICC|nr:GNAT family protein [Paeniglutamicibacter psychrophenolicus]MBP2372405.1 RimJ/RimL family protein N-acetyltransferase [Paeniglutamicibacter psychrophenolicus]